MLSAQPVAIPANLTIFAAKGFPTITTARFCGCFSYEGFFVDRLLWNDMASLALISPIPLKISESADPLSSAWIDLAQHQTFNALGAPGLVIALDYDRAEADVAGGGFEARGHAA